LYTILISEFLTDDTTAQEFKRITQDQMLPSGSWPFSCKKLMPCNNIPHQACGCQNLLDSENLAVVYNLKKAGNNSQSVLIKQVFVNDNFYWWHLKVFDVFD
jgi:hypothetical protein